MHGETKKDRADAKVELTNLYLQYTRKTIDLALKLEQMTGLETRVTILGHLQRGGTPSCADRLLATMLGSECARHIIEGKYGVMISSQHGKIVPVPLETVAGSRKTVPLDHLWIQSARKIGIGFGD